MEELNLMQRNFDKNTAKGSHDNGRPAALVSYSSVCFAPFADAGTSRD